MRAELRVRAAQASSASNSDVELGLRRLEVGVKRENSVELKKRQFRSSITYYLLFCAFLVPFMAYMQLHVNQSIEPSASSIGYAVVDGHQCGTEEEKVLRVMEWTRRMGGYIHRNVTTGMFPIEGEDGSKTGRMVRGLKANGTIHDHEILFRIPPKLLINVGTVSQDPNFAEVWKSIPQFHKGLSGLAVYLIHESLNKSSFWRPYLCALPRHVPLPIFYSERKFERERREKILKPLPEQVTRFDDLIERARDVLEVHYVELMPKLFSQFPLKFSPADYTYARWAWACSIIMSRTWGRKFKDDVLGKMTGENVSVVHTLVPAADMPNHKTGTHEASSTPDGSLLLKASANLSAGDQIFISYGKKCNAEFLANYGFVPNNNSHLRCYPNCTYTCFSNRCICGWEANSTEHVDFNRSKLGPVSKHNVTSWRNRWRSHFARFYGNLAKVQQLAARDKALFAKMSMGNTSIFFQSPE